MDPYAPGGRLYQGPPPSDGSQYGSHPDGAFPMAPLPPPPPLVFPGAPPLQGAGGYGTQSLDPYAPGGRLYQPPAAEPHAAALAAAPGVRFGEGSSTAEPDESGNTSDPEPDEFAPADTFAGVRAGYAFKMGTLGPGYYLDNRGAAAEAMRKAREEAAAARMATLYPPAPPVPAAKQVDPSVALGKIQKCLANPKKASKVSGRGMIGRWRGGGGRWLVVLHPQDPPPLSPPSRPTSFTTLASHLLAPLSHSRRA